MVDNIDATVVVEQPKLGDCLDEMREQLSRALGVAPEQVNVKASTSEELGFVGREEGIAAHAVALIRNIR